MSMPFMNVFWTQRANDKNRGQYAALYTISWGIGNTVGPFLISTLVDATNFKIAFIVMSIVLSIASVGFYKLDSRK
jgi:MFS family permease